MYDSYDASPVFTLQSDKQKIRMYRTESAVDTRRLLTKPASSVQVSLHSTPLKPHMLCDAQPKLRASTWLKASIRICLPCRASQKIRCLDVSPPSANRVNAANKGECHKVRSHGSIAAFPDDCCDESHNLRGSFLLRCCGVAKVLQGLEAQY
jgi:hypothetical protein